MPKRNSPSPRGPRGASAGRIQPPARPAVSIPADVQAARDAAMSACYGFSRAWRAAGEEWDRRVASSAEMVRNGKWTENDRVERMQPWLAIACLAGCDIPDLEEGLERLTVRHVDDPAQSITTTQARILLAQEICPIAKCREELHRANDTVSRQARGHEADGDPVPPAIAETAARLDLLVRVFCVNPQPLPTVPVVEEQKVAA